MDNSLLILIAAVFWLVCMTPVNSIYIFETPASSATRIDCSGVSGVGLSRDQCLILYQKNLDEFSQFCTQSTISGDITPCPCQQMMTEVDARPCKQKCPDLYHQCREVFLTTAAPTTKAASIPQTPANMSTSTELDTSNAPITVTDSDTTLMPTALPVVVKRDYTVLYCMVSAVTVGTFVFLVVGALRRRSGKCPALCCNCDLDCWLAKVFVKCAMTTPNLTAQYSAPQQVEHEVPAAEQEAHMVEPAYRNVDPPE